jgi:hypothetical protein
MMPVYTFAYLLSGREHHRGRFNSGLGVQEFAETLSKLGPSKPTDEIWVWLGDDTGRRPDGLVLRTPAAVA